MPRTDAAKRVFSSPPFEGGAGWGSDAIEREFDRLAKRSPWMASFIINGEEFGAGLNHDHDVRPPEFFRLVPQPQRILELGSCQGGGTFQLARHPGVREVVAIEGRDFNIEKAEFVQGVLGASQVRFLQGNLETFDFRPLGRFDAVYCVGVLYHLPKPWEFVAKLAKVTDLLYINTHYCPRNEISMTLHGYEGKQWAEFGYEDPLSGMSAWSFWPTLRALTQMLRDAGFIPQILETDTTGTGQSPHGTTILARRQAVLSPEVQTILMEKTQQVLANLSRSAGSLQPIKTSWWRRWLVATPQAESRVHRALRLRRSG
jgi:SAM-dependent methyltransferase